MRIYLIITIMLLAVLLIGCQKTDVYNVQTDVVDASGNKVQETTDNEPETPEESPEEEDEQTEMGNESTEIEDNRTINIELEENQLISEYHKIKVTYNEEINPDKVMFYIDDMFVKTDFTVPFSWNMNNEEYREGMHTIKAVLYDIFDGTFEDEVSIKIIHGEERLCGDSVCDESENCETCRKDCICSVGKLCSPSESGADKMGCI